MTVAIGPKNFLASPGKKGGGHSGLFSKPTYMNESFNTEIPRHRPNRSVPKAKISSSSLHERAFRLGGVVRRKLSPYEYETPYKIPKINRRNPDGSVQTELPQFRTCPPKKGRSYTPGLMFSEPISHRPDPYDEEHRQRMNEMKAKALLRPEVPWCAMGTTGKTFTKDYDTFYDAEIKAPARKKPLEFAHPDPEVPRWKTNSPIKTHRNDTFEKHPVYMENPLKSVTRR